MERKLAAIVAADVVGYSRLMGEDEAGTLSALQCHREELIAPKAAQYRGRIVKLMGDGALLEFSSVVDAVIFAVEMQVAMRQRNITVPKDRQILFRIGVNLGDIILEGDDIHGDGVNIAARLEGLAEPGGICLSRSARNQVRDKLDLEFRDLGLIEAKNIARPLRVFQVVLDARAAALATPSVIQPAIGGHSQRRIIAIGLAVGLLLMAGAVWWQPWTPRFEPASLERMAFPLPNRPSVAVLPFANMSKDPGQEYFADGMTEDLITDLSNISGLFVIARNSTFAYKDRLVEAAQVAEDLGVRYVLQGSVRRVGERVRINAQLIDAMTGGQMWADRYDGSLKDVFALQDKVTRNIVTALAVKLTVGEQARQGAPDTEYPDAYDAFLRGWVHYRRGTPDDFAKAISDLEAAVELDPDYSRAYGALSAIYWSIIDKNWSTGTSAWSQKLGITTDQSLRRETQYLDAAMENPDALAYQVASGRLSRQGRHEAAISAASRAIEMNPNDPIGYEAMGAALIYAGRSAEAAVHIRQAMRLDPWFPQEYFYWLGLAEFGMERFESAVETLSVASVNNPDDDRSLLILAAAYGHLGRKAEAEAAATRANKVRQERQQGLASANVEAGVDFLLVGPFTQKDVDLWPLSDHRDRDRLSMGLRLAGLPATGEGDDVSPRTVRGAETVDAAAAKMLFDRGVTFIDVRGDGSWNNGHIPNAVHLDLKAHFNETTLSEKIAKDQEAVIYCMGPRCLLSSRACAQAVAWGYRKIYYFREGFPSWKSAGYPVAVP